MSAADLLVDGFPHGTVAGYRQGCRSEGGCPGGFGQTCVRANLRSSSDWQYGKALAKDREEEFLEREVAAVPVPAPKPVRVAAAKRNQERQARIPSPVVASEPVTVAEAADPVKGKHGTTWGYQQGCHDAEVCPGDADGRTCPGVYREYQRAYRARKKAELEQQRAVTVPEPESVDVALAITPEPADVPSSPEPPMVDESVEDEEPRPRGKRVLDDALRTITEAAELQRALVVITERALRTARIEINHMRRDAAAFEKQQEK